ncbi:MAG: peroxiredoxin [Wenzhouxiangella sp.]|nr:MAG: peroxiredoxin [Wenzhouxiangella sp.]
MSQDPKLSSTKLPASGDRTLKLSDFKGKPLVVYFYPRDNTPGCTKQGQGFRDLYDEFQAENCEIVGVSRDTAASHDKFAAKHEFPFPLLADTDEALCREFDVIKEKNMYGKKVMGIERSTFLFDAKGKLVKAWRKVRVPGHVEEVLEAARALD